MNTNPTSEELGMESYKSHHFEERAKNTLSKPYPNFHAARMKSPGSFVRIRVLRTLPNGVMIYGGPLRSDPRGGAKTQSFRFPKDKFTARQAKAWLREHDHSYTLFEPATGVTRAKKSETKWPTIIGE